MDLNQPVFDSVLAIDAQLQKLQLEVKQMDKEFADYQPKAAAQLSQSKVSTPSPEISEERKVDNDSFGALKKQGPSRVTF